MTSHAHAKIVGDTLFSRLTANLKKTTISTNLTQDILETAADMFLYVNTCPPTEFPHMLNYVSLNIRNLPIGENLLTLNRLRIMSITNQLYFESAFRNIMKKIFDTWPSKIKDVEALLYGKDSSESSDSNNSILSVSETDYLSKLVNHPVHIIDENNNYNPSSLIPFCGFGRNLEAEGTKVRKFSIAVCNNFEKILRNDQVCYQLDPNNFFNNYKKESDLKKGLFLMIDDNKDLQYSFQHQKKENIEGGFARFLTQEKGDSRIYFNDLDSFQFSPGLRYNLDALLLMLQTTILTLKKKSENAMLNIQVSKKRGVVI